MLISREREKLLEAIKYFAANTKYCGLTKLFKLLFFLDFTHFRETGRAVTGLRYSAYQMGPVPDDLYAEIRGPAMPDLTSHLRITGSTEVERGDGTTARVPAKIDALRRFNPKLFTKRELRIMEQLAFLFKEAKAKDMSEVSHLKGQPWHTTVKTRGLRSPIDYMLALDGQADGQLPRDELLARLEEREEVERALK